VIPLASVLAIRYLSTDPTQTAEQIIGDFMKRPGLEVIFEEGRAHVGIETRAPMVRPGHPSLNSSALWSLQSRDPRMAQAAHPDGCIPVARVSLVSQADCHLTFRACSRQTTPVGLRDFSHITY